MNLQRKKSSKYPQKKERRNKKFLKFRNDKKSSIERNKIHEILLVLQCYEVSSPLLSNAQMQSLELPWGGIFLHPGDLRLNRQAWDWGTQTATTSQGYLVFFSFYFSIRSKQLGGINWTCLVQSLTVVESEVGSQEEGNISQSPLSFAAKESNLGSVHSPCHQPGNHSAPPHKCAPPLVPSRSPKATT